MPAERETTLPPAPALAPWKPIVTAPCDDTWGYVLWKDGSVTFTDIDHDSDPEWWAERGATHWRDAMPEERAREFQDD